VLGGVHFIEVHLQQKTVGGTEISVQSGGVHFIEVFTKGGFTVSQYQPVFNIESTRLWKSDLFDEHYILALEYIHS